MKRKTLALLVAVVTFTVRIALAKLLRTTAIEAVAERHGSEKTEAVSADSINEFLANAERGQESTNDVTERTHMIKRESEKGLFFETRDMAQAGAWVHRKYLAK